MTSKSFIKEVALKYKNSGVTQKSLKMYVDIIEDSIKDRIASGEQFKVCDLTFSVKDVPACERRNPMNGETIHCDETKKLKVKPSVDMKRVVRGE